MALVAIVVALAIGELALRTIVRSYAPLSFDLYYPNDRGELRLRGHQRRQSATPEWNVRIETNRDGFRDVDRPPRPGEPVIVGLGDSFAFGWGVDYRDMFLTRLEGALGGASAVRVIKAGVPGTGTTDQLALLHDLKTTLRPDVVLLAFFVGNDFNDVAEGGTSQFRIVDGLLLRRTEAVEERWRFAALRGWLKRHSYLAQLAAQQLWLYEKQRIDRVPVDARVHEALDSRDYWLGQFLQVHLRAPFAPKLQAGVDRTLEALTTMQQLARADGARFVLLVIPRSIQVYDADRRRYQQAFRLQSEDWDMDRPQRILRRWADEHNAELLDCLPELRLDARRDAKRLYYFPDSHMTAEGHARVADALVRYFRATGIKAQ